MTLRLFGLIFSSVAMNALAHVLLRKAMTMVTLSDVPRRGVLDVAMGVALNPYLLMGMSIYAVSIVVWLIVLSHVEVSVAYPFQSMGFLIAAGFGFFFLGEHVGIQRLSGIMVTCVGLVLISRSA